MSGRTAGRTRIAGSAIVVLVVLVAASLLAAGPAPAAELTFGLVPAGGSPGSAGQFFDLKPAPGSRTALTLVVSNPGDSALGVHLQAVDGYTASYGGIAYALPNEPREAAGAWIRGLPQVVTVAAGTEARVPFELCVPERARPGDHVCGVSAWVPVTTESPSPASADDTASVSVRVQTRRVVPVVAHVPGPAEAHLTIQGVEPQVSSGGVHLKIRISNDGGLLAKGSGTIELPGQGFVKEFELGTSVPDTTIDFPVPWTQAAENGTYTATASIQYDDGRKTAAWNGEFTIGDTQQKELQERVAGYSLPTSNLGWYIMAGLGALILILGGVLIGRRRSA